MPLRLRRDVVATFVCGYGSLGGEKPEQSLTRLTVQRRRVFADFKRLHALDLFAPRQAVLTYQIACGTGRLADG